MSNKRTIIENFDILAQYWKTQGGRQAGFRRAAYQNAIRAIKGLEIDDITDVRQVKNVKGLGKKTRVKIQEYLESGHIAAADKAKSFLQGAKQGLNSKQEAIALFKSVEGIGHVTAVTLWSHYNKLSKVKRPPPLEWLRQNSQLLNQAQYIGLKYYKDLLKRIPREYISMMNLLILLVLNKKFGPKSYEMKVAGSYRRGNKDSGDIDVLITSKKFTLKQCIQELQKWKIIVDTISMKGEEKFMGICHCPSGQWFYFHIDIVFLPKDEWGAGLLWFTGSKGFNITMRATAKKKGYLLNQHGLFNKNKIRVPVYTEREIMNHLGMKWIPPHAR